MVEGVREFFAKPSRAILAGYLGLALSAAAIVGVYVARADSSAVIARQAELSAQQAEIRADQIADRANEALANAAAQCIARQEARRDGDEILLRILNMFPDSPEATQVRALIASRDPINC